MLPYSKRKRKKIAIIFYIALGICFAIIFWAARVLDYVEVDPVLDWIKKYFALPVLLAMVPTSTFIYLKFIRFGEKENYKSVFRTRLRTVFRIITLTIATSLILLGTTICLINLTNAYIGSPTIINLKATVIDYRESESKGVTYRYIKIKDKQLNRTVELEVYKGYQVGDPFSETLEIGQWGLLFRRK